MCIEVLNGMADTIAQLEEKLAEREWIPCSERLPSKDGQYLVYMDYGEMDVYMWAEGWNCIRRLNGMVTREYEINGIVAWMPLPEPYREDGEA